MRVTSRLAIRVFHLYFKDFIEGNVKVFDTKKASPPNPLSYREGECRKRFAWGMLERGT